MSRLREFYAHTLPGRPAAEWQPLEEHLCAVASTAARFAGSFGSSDWGRLAGLWHDLGKYSTAFQRYLRQATDPDAHAADGAPRTDHSTAGAKHAKSAIDLLGHLLAYVIAGHHSGLLDARSSGACLESRFEKIVESWDSAPERVLDQPAPNVPEHLGKALGHKDAFSVAFFVRMLFSSLVDADFLDTERFMNPGRSDARAEWPSDVLARIEQAVNAYAQGLSRTGKVNAARAEVRQACLAAATKGAGMFSLTVPTGGGKTLSSLAFSLRHAQLHDMRRVIYVVPFTSIIEQNADEFRKVARALGAIEPDPVIEHHSDFDPSKETTTSRLATENWDAPLVVTTSVQFYESLFANRTSRCRKLHNLAGAVIVLDEVQTLPVDYLAPCLRALRELGANYGSTVVLCTATQPAITCRDGFPIGLEGVREIIPKPERLYSRLKRVEVEALGNLDDAVLADRLLEHERVLCVVNTRKHARELFLAVNGASDAFHLSALMCPEHRSQTLAQIRRSLDSPGPCRVVSTQLIEAGVDIDFPVVYRSLAGLDSIAQAAGRCNRNGRHERGKTFIFEAENVRAESFFAETANCARQVLPMHDDPLSLEAVEHYFRLYYWDQASRWDSQGVLRDFQLNQDPKLPFLFAFKSVAERFRLIQRQGKPVIVPWNDRAKGLCDQLRDERVEFGRLRGLLRDLQRFTVQIPERVWQQHVGGALELVRDQFAVLASPELHYSDRFGLDLDREIYRSLVF